MKIFQLQSSTRTILCFKFWCRSSILHYPYLPFWEQTVIKFQRRDLSLKDLRLDITKMSKNVGVLKSWCGPCIINKIFMNKLPIYLLTSIRR